MCGGVFRACTISGWDDCTETGHRDWSKESTTFADTFWNWFTHYTQKLEIRAPVTHSCSNHFHFTGFTLLFALLSLSLSPFSVENISRNIQNGRVLVFGYSVCSTANWHFAICGKFSRFWISTDFTFLMDLVLNLHFSFLLTSARSWNDSISSTFHFVLLVQAIPFVWIFCC